jgi:hypothetical protein
MLQPACTACALLYCCQVLYKRVCEYLELTTRVEVLNNRFGVLQEMLDMLRNEQNRHHQSRLEWIVIWLIVLSVSRRDLAAGDGACWGSITRVASGCAAHMCSMCVCASCVLDHVRVLHMCVYVLHMCIL